MVKETGPQSSLGGQAGYQGQGSSPSANREKGGREDFADTAMSAAEHARSAASDKIEEQKKAASKSIDSFAQAIRRASDELKDQDQTAAAQLIQQAAGSLESLSRTLSNQSLGDMISTVRDFGRRNPVALAGGAALLGLALGRVARTAADGSQAGNGHGEASDFSRHSYPSSSPSSTAATSRSGYGSAGEFPASRASAGSPSVAGKSPSQSGTAQSGTSHGAGAGSGFGKDSPSGSANQSRSGMGGTPQDSGKRSGGSS